MPGRVCRRVGWRHRRRRRCQRRRERQAGRRCELGRAGRRVGFDAGVIDGHQRFLDDAGAAGGQVGGLVHHHTAHKVGLRIDQQSGDALAVLALELECCERMIVDWDIVDLFDFGIVIGQFRGGVGRQGQCERWILGAHEIDEGIGQVCAEHLGFRCVGGEKDVAVFGVDVEMTAVVADQRVIRGFQAE